MRECSCASQMSSSWMAISIVSIGREEILWKRSKERPLESVISECDDHLCRRNDWSCGDGQSIRERGNFRVGDTKTV